MSQLDRKKRYLKRRGEKKIGDIKVEVEILSPQRYNRRKESVGAGR